MEKEIRELIFKRIDYHDRWDYPTNPNRLHSLSYLIYRDLLQGGYLKTEQADAPEPQKDAAH